MEEGQESLWVTAGRACAQGVGGELETWALQAQGSREPCHEKVSVASQGLTFPSAPENQAAKSPLGWDKPLATALPVSFPDRCNHSPGCTCGLGYPHPALAPVLAGSVLGRTSPWSQALFP